MWLSIQCAAQILDIPATKYGGRISVACNQGSLMVDYRKWFALEGIPELSEEALITYEEVLQDAYKFDRIFMNLGHHALRADGDVIWSFEVMAQNIFSTFKTQLAGQPARLAWIDHPPSHFPTQDGGFNKSLNPYAISNCRCDQPNLAEQPILKNNRVAAQLASTYGFEYLSFASAMIGLCQDHPQDCLHYRMSPSVWSAPIRSLTAAMQQS